MMQGWFSVKGKFSKTVHPGSRSPAAAKHNSQDTTELNFNTRRKTTGLGPVNDSISSLGLFIHSALAVTTTGLPLGLMGLDIWARDIAGHGKRDRRKEKTVSEKESNKWLEAMDKSLLNVPNDIRAVTVCDRESDIFDFAAKAVAENRHLLFRVAQNRGVQSEYKTLFEHVNQAPIQGHCTVDAPRKPGNNQPPRQALLTIRTCRVTIKPPLKRVGEHLSPITLYAADAREENAPVRSKICSLARRIV